VTAHNIANLNTPGYARQRLHLQALSHPVPLWGQLGSGVLPSSLERVQDQFLERHIQQSLPRSAYYEQMAAGLSQIEAVLAEPDGGGLNDTLAEFFAQFQQLAESPEDRALRTTVVGTAQRLTDLFRSHTAQLDILQRSAGEQIGQLTQEVNDIAQQLSELNVQITSVTAGGGSPNDLLDQRDRLLSDLSRLATVEVNPNQYGAVNVFIGGHALVEGSTARPLEFVDGQLRFAESGQPVTLFDGQLKALTDLREEVIPRYQQHLDTLATTLRDEVNAQHRAGYGLDGQAGRDLFVGDEARTLAVSPDLAANVDLLAASASGAVGDGNNALNIAALRDRLVLGGQTQTLSGFYQSVVGSLGAETSGANSSYENAEQIVTTLQDRRDSISSVSLDEELVNMLRFQQAYTAAARIVRVVDEMLEVAVNLV
jgi:flagellar hook-associated protein 1 FlgK